MADDALTFDHESTPHTRRLIERITDCIESVPRSSLGEPWRATE